MSKTGEYWFRSSLFQVEPGEDEEINPGIYGRQLARWLGTKLSGLGYAVEFAEEDWGRCIICARKPIRLWVGCANVPDEEGSSISGEMLWHCFVVGEVPFWKRLFSRTDPAPMRDQLTREMSALLQSEPRIRMVEYGM